LTLRGSTYPSNVPQPNQAAMVRSQLYLANTFSINMLPRDYHNYKFLPISPFEAAAILYVLRDRVTNIIGHADTAALVELVLRAQAPELELPEPQRLTVQLDFLDEVLVAQYTGPRLPKGATQLPEGARIDFWLVESENSMRQGVMHEIVDRWRYRSALPFLQRLQYAVDEFLRWCYLYNQKYTYTYPWCADVYVRAGELLAAMRWLKEVDGIEYPSVD